MGSSTQVYVYKKNQGLKFQFILGRLENVLAVVFCTTRLGKTVFGVL